jgi:O-antigen ligase
MLPAAVLAGMIVVSAISILRAINVSEGIFELLKLTLMLILFILLTMYLSQSTGRHLSISKAVTVASAALSAISIFQFFSIGFLWIPGNVIPYATMANKNLLSSFLLFALPFAACLYIRSDRAWKLAAGVTIWLSLYVIIISQTRSVWVALAVSTVVIILISLFHMRGTLHREVRRALVRIGAIASSALLAGILTLSLDSPDAGRLSPSTPINMSDASLKQRIALWDKSADMYLDNSATGVGIGNWKIEIPRYGSEGLPTEHGTVFFQRPHNDFLWVLTETGPLGLLCYVSLFGFALYFAGRIAIKGASDDDRMLAIMMLFGIVAVVIVSMFSYPRERIAHSALLILMISVMSARYGKLFGKPRPIRRRTFFATAAAIVILLGCCIAVGAVRLNAEIHTKRAIAAKAAEDWRSVISEIDRASTPISNLDPTSTPLAWYRGVANFSLNNFEAAMADFKEAYKANPYHIHVLNNIGTCFEIMSHHDSAVFYYEKALKIIPAFEETLVNLAAVYYNAGDYEKALSYLMQVGDDPRDARYYRYFEVIRDQIEAQQDTAITVAPQQ